MARFEKPTIGTKMYSVHEHRYYQKEKRTAPFLEYVVCESEVVDFFTGGYTEICLRGMSPEGWLTPYRYNIGKKIFYTPKEAANFAKQMTEKYDRTWGWMDEPLRRSWEVYL